MKLSSKNLYLLVLAFIGFLFFTLGFSTGINSYLIPFLREAFNISIATSYLVIAATFSAYVLLGVPSGLTIRMIGYKGGMVLSFIIMAIGMYLFVPSAKIQSFPLFILALFIVGAGQTLLQTSINPYITIIGPRESAAARICVNGILNKIAFALGPLLLSIFMDLKLIRIDDVPRPFIMITVVLLVCAVIAYYFPLPDVSVQESGNQEIKPEKDTPGRSIFQYPHVFLGAIAIFFDVGVEMISLGTILDYALQSKLPDLFLFNINLHSPEIFVSYATIAMVLGYLAGIIFIPGKISQQKALVYSAIWGTVITLAIMISPGYISVWLVALLGFGNAILWPAIWPLSLADLGNHTKTGSSILIIGVIGGAVIPLLFGWMADISSYQVAYWICIPCYVYLLYFATLGHKIRK